MYFFKEIVKCILRYYIFESILVQLNFDAEDSRGERLPPGGSARLAQEARRSERRSQASNASKDGLESELKMS